MTHNGDILKFEQALIKDHKKDLHNGARYVAYKVPEYEELAVFLEGKKYCEFCGRISQFKHFTIIGNVFGEW